MVPTECRGEMRATHVRMATGRTRSDGVSHRVTKLYHARLAAEVRTELWAGRESGELVCGCNYRLQWTSREQVCQLQWHMFACSLPEETSIRRRWLSMVRRNLAAHIKDAAVVRAIARCWAHIDGGYIAVAEQDQRQQWRAPSVRWRDGAITGIPRRVGTSSPSPFGVHAMAQESKEAEHGTLVVVETVWGIVGAGPTTPMGALGGRAQDAPASSTTGWTLSSPRCLRTSDTTSRSGREGPGRSMLARSLASCFWAPLGAAHSHDNHLLASSALKSVLASGARISRATNKSHENNGADDGNVNTGGTVGRDGERVVALLSCVRDDNGDARPISTVWPRRSTRHDVK